MGTVSTLTAEWIIDARKFYSELNAGKSALVGFAKDLQATGREIMQFGQGLDRMVSAPIRELGKSMLEAAGRMETSQIAFKALTGSASLANRTLEQLADLADHSSFTFEGIQQTSKQLLASGYAAEDLIPMLKDVGNAVGAIGGGNEMIARVVHNLAQMRAQGFLTGRDLRDLANTGLPVWDVLAEKLGTDVAGALQMVHDKAVGAEEGIQMILEGLSDRFPHAMEDQAKSIEGLWSTLTDVADRALRTIGKDLADTFGVKSILNDAIVMVQSLTAQFVALDPATKATLFTMAAVAAVAGPALVVFGQLAIGVGGLVIAFGAILTPVGAVVIAFAAATAGVVALWQESEALRSATASIWADIQAIVGEAIGGSTADVTGFIAFMKDVATTGMKDVNALFEITLSVIKNAFHLWRAVSEGDWSAAMMSFVNIANRFRQVEDIFRSVWTAIKLVFSSAIGEIKQQFQGMADFILAQLAKLPGAGLLGLGTPGDAFAGASGGASQFRSGYVDPTTGVSHALGGLIYGPGGPTADAIPLLASNGEFIMNAAATARNLPLLQAMNSNRFAKGGIVAGTTDAYSGAGLTQAIADFTGGMSTELRQQIEAMQLSGASAKDVLEKISSVNQSIGQQIVNDAVEATKQLKEAADAKKAADAIPKSAEDLRKMAEDLAKAGDQAGALNLQHAAKMAAAAERAAAAIDASAAAVGEGGKKMEFQIETAFTGAAQAIDALKHSFVLSGEAIASVAPHAIGAAQMFDDVYKTLLSSVGQYIGPASLQAIGDHNEALLKGIAVMDAQIAQYLTSDRAMEIFQQMVASTAGALDNMAIQAILAQQAQTQAANELLAASQAATVGLAAVALSAAATSAYMYNGVSYNSAADAFAAMQAAHGGSAVPPAVGTAPAPGGTSGYSGGVGTTEVVIQLNEYELGRATIAAQATYNSSTLRARIG